MRTCIVIALLALASLAYSQSRNVDFTEDFAKGADRWEPSDAAAWKVEKTDKGYVYHQFQQSKYKGPHRSPFNFSLIKDLVLEGDFTLTAKLQSTGKDVPHRDMCLFFCQQDPAHLYYVHLGKQADDHANQIFIVNAADRKKISTTSTPGTKWTDGWHTVRVVRRGAEIEIFFDDMKTPAMMATDKTFTWGRVGIGSFDDTGKWTDIHVIGTRAAGK